MFDVTQRIEQERVLREALAEEHRRYRQVVVASGQVVYEEDVPARTLMFSENLREVFGYTSASHGSSPEDWLGKVHPEDRERVMAAGRLALSGRRAADLEYRYRHADGSYRWVWDRCTFDFDDSGLPVRIVGVMQDVTARKEMEAQISAAQRMETIGALTGSVAHDLNNILTAVLMNVAMARMKLEADEEPPELQDAADAAARGADLVKSLLSFARRQGPRRETIHAGALLNESLRLLERIAGAAVRVEARADEQCPPFEGDRVQVQQVLLNLVVNARDAMGGAGTVTVAAREAETRHRETGEPGRFVHLQVADTGPGVPLGLQERIFQPYFTTRGPGEGTGLGLSIVHGVARAHGGWAEVTSPPGKGAIFSVYFPAGTAAAAEDR